MDRIVDGRAARRRLGLGSPSTTSSRTATSPSRSPWPRRSPGARRDRGSARRCCSRALRPPLQIAEEAAIVDLVSGGRLELGLGAGYRVPEFAAFGADPARRFALLRETVRELRRIWDEGACTPPPLQDPVPLWLAS